jgi:hypothetical protein
MKRSLIIASMVMILSLALIRIASAGSATISWNPNTDGDLTGYKIYYGKTNGGPYGSSTALISKTLSSYTISSLDTGTYYFVVVAVDTAENESTPSTQVSKTISAATSPAIAVTLTPNISSPQNVGATVTFTAQASGGGGTYEYQFWRRSPSGVWSVIQNYSSNKTFAWDTKGAAGTNMISVRARSAGTNVTVDKGLDYVIRIAPITVVTLMPNISSPQKANKIVTFTAQASGGSGSYEYQFWRRSPSGVWSVIQNYSSKNTFVWNTKGAAGTNMISVRARSAGTNVTKDKGVTFVIK